MSKLEANIFGYSTSGFEIPQLIVRADTPEELAGLLRGLAANGITVNKPDPSEVSGEKTETITCIVKRMHVGKDNRETPVIDMYPSWQGEYGQFRFVGLYLNTPEQIAEFEGFAGIRVADIPVYESQAPLQRNANRKHRCEIACTPFIARKLPDGEKVIDGKSQTVWKFAGYAPLEGASAPQTTGQNGNGQHNSDGKQNGNSDFKAPSWWNPVLKIAIPKYYNGVQQHATNSVKKMLAEGTLTNAMKTDEVLAVLEGRREGEEAEQPPATDYSDIPF